MTDVKDLDETRRLLYMALLVPHTDKYELAGTLINALVHHQNGGDPTEVKDRLLGVLAGASTEDADWAAAQISRITAELGRVRAHPRHS